ncbi:hypothetical protein [Hahella ganghwensis]|uniref:hypothetical protein n=1 Tax=Hahella ganghwensis TaxID=286420 RepID=UPI00035D4A9F|nr:hypothetical protein [Hahella ganghwensis]
MDCHDAHSVRNILEKLVAAPECLLTYRLVRNPYELMELLSDRFGLDGVSSSSLLQLIQQEKGVAIEPPLPTLLKFWRPAAYSIPHGKVQWRLVGEDLPFAPFYDDQILHSTCQSLLATLLKPCTRLDYLLRQSASVDVRPPKGFIFHLSRCGSTLLANAMAATGNFTVVSEASYLRDLLLDPHLSEDDKVQGLRTLLSCHGPDAIVKLNAWDICFFPLIKQAFPSSRMVFQIRAPECILASHHRQAGIHMVPGYRVAEQIGVEFRSSLPDYQARVLISLMKMMLSYRSAVIPGDLLMLDYRQLNLDAILEIAAFFGCRVSRQQKMSVIAMMKRDAKDLSKNYSAVTKHHASAADCASDGVEKSVREQLNALYRRCLSNVSEVPEAASH